MIYVTIIISKFQKVILGHLNFSVSLPYITTYHESLSYAKIIIRCFCNQAPDRLWQNI